MQSSTPLHYAVRIGPRHQTEDLLDLFYSYGADLDVQTTHGETPLHQVAFRGNYANASWLLAHGASPNIVDKHGHTPLHKAAMAGHKFAVATLLDHGCDPSVV
jgi:ankyrin repeat protein